LKSHPLGFDQILEELGNRTAALERELIGEGSDFGMDGQVHLPAELTVGIGFSWHMMQCGKILVALQSGIHPISRVVRMFDFELPRP
jgi:hypothetical protein